MGSTKSVWREQSAAQAHVATVSWFTVLSDEQQRLVLRTCNLRSVAAGATAGRRGAVPEHWAGVVRGLLKASASDAEGKVSSYLLARRSQWIDGEELVQNAPRLHDVVAVADSLLIVVPSVVFQQLLTSNIDFCGFVLRQTSYQHRRLMERIDGERSCSKSVLVAQVVAELARDLGSDGMSSVELKQEDIAEFVGFSRQTVNQILRALAAEGLLRTRYSRVEVGDVFALQKFASAI
jgi:CRP-like cAMP-binding protein